MKPRFQLLFNVIMFLIVSDDCFGGDHYALPVEDLEMVHFFHSSKPIQIHKAIHDTVAVAKSIISLSLQSQFCIQVTRKIHKAMGRTIYQEKDMICIKGTSRVVQRCTNYCQNWGKDVNKDSFLLY